jgi:A/G-specific adenine glycosylase
LIKDNHPEFAQKLLYWWSMHKRIFPWRTTKQPYEILIAEILLHRTKAIQVVPVYLNFIKEFPNIPTLLSVPTEYIEQITHTLGLNWRAKMIKQMAEVIAKKYKGEIPMDKNELLSLPGIGNYIASAFLCFTSNICEPLLDTNTVRILGRVFCIPVTDSSRRMTNFKSTYISLCSKDNPRDFGFAMIDLAAQVCLSGKPLCETCPVLQFCSFGIRKTGEKYESETCY